MPGRKFAVEKVKGEGKKQEAANLTWHWEALDL